MTQVKFYPECNPPKSRNKQKQFCFACKEYFSNISLHNLWHETQDRIATLKAEGHKIFTCEECKTYRFFPHEGALEQHRFEKHNGKPPAGQHTPHPKRAEYCAKCNMHFKNIMALTNHNFAKHGGPKYVSKTRGKSDFEETLKRKQLNKILVRFVSPKDEKPAIVTPPEKNK